MTDITRELVEKRIAVLVEEMGKMELRYQVMLGVKHEMEQWLEFVDGHIDGGLQPAASEEGKETGSAETPAAAPEGQGESGTEITA